ncbi:MAG: hypothetical protein J6P39_00245, partial [Oscillospiraceae bacterium]|nr:hypothetical protein [Oscillospiraceae bacterium]
YLILRRVLTVAMRRAGGKKTTPVQKQRIETVSQMLRSVLKYLMLIIVLLEKQICKEGKNHKQQKHVLTLLS